MILTCDSGGPWVDLSKPKRKFITTQYGMSGYFAVLMDSDGIIQTGIGRYEDELEAEKEAREWAEAEGIELKL